MALAMRLDMALGFGAGIDDDEIGWGWKASRKAKREDVKADYPCIPLLAGLSDGIVGSVNIAEFPNVSDDNNPVQSAQ